MNHSCCGCGANASNHINQSRRRWYGAICGGRRVGSPGFPLNWYSRHFVELVTV